MDSNLLKTKSIEQLVSDVEHGGKALKRSLSAWDLTLLGVGAIIGTGIFVLTGTAAANQAGPAIMVSYLAAGLACAFAAFCYAEFASMVPIAGSAYTYAYASLGEVVAWMIGWDLILEYAVGSMTVAIGWSGYMQRLLSGVGIVLPHVDERCAVGELTGGHHQPPGRDHRPAHHGAAGHRRARERALQRRDGRHQGRGHPVLHCRRLHLRAAGELDAVRALRLVRHHDSGRRRLLRLHRLRRGVDHGRGGQEPAARSAHRHHRLAGGLHAALSRGRGDPRGHRPRRRSTGPTPRVFPGSRPPTPRR